MGYHTMGYNTDFRGEFYTDKKVDDKTFGILRGLATTRRVKRDMSKLYKDMTAEEIVEKFGYDGEFYFDGDDADDSVIDCNTPPATQPGVWCQWYIDDDGETIAWDGSEKFYNYVEWIRYIVDRILKPRGYVLNGEVEWQGEDYEDKGKIVVKENEVKVFQGRVVYDEI